MSYNLTPITAKIKKTTKGGITQPLLNVGAAVKMKAPSPNKQVVAKLGGKLVKEAGKRLLPAVKNTLPKVKSYTAEVIGKGSKGAGRKVQKNISDASYKNAKASTAGTGLNVLKKAAKYGMFGVGTAIATNLMDYFSGGDDGPTTPTTTTPTTTPTTTTPTTTETKKKNKPYVKKGGKATGNMKDYKLNSQARRDEYTARGWKQDDTTKVARKKAEKVNTITAKPVSIDNKISADPSKVAAKKQTSGKVSTYNKVKAAKLAKDGARKTGKAFKKQSQADEARAEGNTRKANRKQKAADRKTLKASKKFSQAAGAIQPK
jgi:hypothetical protein